MKSAVSTTLSLLTLVASQALARNFTIVNKCSYAVWRYADPNVGSALPAIETGWQAVPGSSRLFIVSDTWKGGQIWGRTECSFSSSRVRTCATGGSNAALKCTGLSSGQTTFAEFTSGASNGQDWTNVSLVGGFDVPLEGTNNAGYMTWGSKPDLNSNCPAPLRRLNASGKTVGCKLAFAANIHANPVNSKNCPTSLYDTPSTCSPSLFQHYSHFKNVCPRVMHSSTTNHHRPPHEFPAPL